MSGMKLTAICCGPTQKAKFRDWVFSIVRKDAGSAYGDPLRLWKSFGVIVLGLGLAVAY